MRRRRSLLTSRSRDPSSSTDGRRHTAITASSIATVAIGVHGHHRHPHRGHHGHRSLLLPKSQKMKEKTVCLDLSQLAIF